MDARSPAKNRVVGSTSKGVDTLNLAAPERKRLRGSSSGSEGESSFTEVTRRSTASKAKKHEEAAEPMQTGIVKETSLRSLEDVVFVEFIGLQIKNVNHVHVKRELVLVVGCEVKASVAGNYLRVRSLNAEQKVRVLVITKLGSYAVRVSEPRQLVRERAGNTRKFVRKIVVGVPLDIDDSEIKVELAASTPVVAAKRILKKRDGVLVKTTAVTLDFPVGVEVPSKVLIGFSRYKVREYVAPPTRCYKCLSFGHVALHCKKGQKCSFCAGEHSHTACDKKQTPKCAKCGGEHTVFDAGCPAYAQAKLVATRAAQTGKTYAQALKNVRKEAKAPVSETATQGTMTVLKKGPVAQKAVVVVPKVPTTVAVNEVGSQTEAPEEQTPPVTKLPVTKTDDNMVAPVCTMLRIMLKLVGYVESTLVPTLMAGTKKDIGAETRLNFTKLVALELNIPIDDVFKLILAQSHGAQTPRTATALNDDGC